LPIGLGWIGFAIGFRFEIRALDELPRGTAAAVGLLTAVPFAVIVGACGLLLRIAWGFTPDAVFLRDAILLGTAGAVTARSAPSLLIARGGGAESGDRVARIVQLEELAALAGLVLVAAFFRPQGSLVAWQLPGTAWVFVSLGLGTAVGLLAFALFSSFRSGQQVVVVLIGTICFAAGMASYLRLSPIVVCAIAGLLLASLPGPWKEQLRGALDRLERPIYLLFLFIAGALWRFTDAQGWILMAVFVAARLGGKWLALAIHRRFQLPGLGAAERRSLFVAPIGALAVAIVVNAQDLYSGPSLSWIVTAIIGGSVLTEIVVQVLARARGRHQTSAH
jgi:Kef-type K+ transport system membrane component KefB